MNEHSDLPTYWELMLPTLRAVDSLGGSGKAKEIREQVVAELEPDTEILDLTYETRPTKSIYHDRLDWARSYCKLGGVLESPRRGLFLLTPLGRSILAMTEEDAAERLRVIDSEVRSRRAAKKKDTPEPEAEETGTEPPEDEEEEGDWKEILLARLHRLSPTAFEEFAIYLLKSYGLELRRVGGTGDEGIDGIGTAPLSDVLSATVAVQAKRYDPTKSSIGRSTVALFQRDAAAAGAERAVLVTLGRFTAAAKKAATTTTPTVDLIDGDRIAELARSQELGVYLVPKVIEDWFDRFED